MPSKAMPASLQHPNLVPSSPPKQSPLCAGDCSGEWEETGADRLTKLAYQDARRAAAMKEALREHHYAQYSFAPQINPRSRALGKVGRLQP